MQEPRKNFCPSRCVGLLICLLFLSSKVSLAAEKWFIDCADLKECGPPEAEVQEDVCTLKDADWIPSEPPPLNERFWFLLQEEHQYHPVARAARHLMATAYQSCGVLALPTIEGFCGNGPDGTDYQQGKFWLRKNGNTALAKKHYYLKFARNESALGLEESKCSQRNEMPILYSWGGFFDPELFKKEGVVNLFYPVRYLRHDSAPFGGLDCSGFVGASIAAAGLRMFRNMDHANSFRLSVSGLRKNKESGIGLLDLDGIRSSCFRVAKFLGDDSIHSGDVFAYGSRAAHALIIEDVGVDPLGVADFRKASDCNQIGIKHLSKLQFTVIQSSVDNNGLGINRMEARDFFTFTPARQAVLAMAWKACRARFSATQPYRAELVEPESQRVAVLRHTGDVDAACRMNREIRIKNQECVESCWD